MFFGQIIQTTIRVYCYCKKFLHRLGLEPLSPGFLKLSDTATLALICFTAHVC